MAIFRKYVEDLWPLVPTVLRRFQKNIINLTHGQMLAAQDVIAEALEDFIDTRWPIPTASTWILDDHWGPYHGLQRNGTTDAGFRLYIRAKRLLNRSWGSADQALQIFRVLLPTADLSFSYFAPKAWVVNITNVDMADAQLAINFMRKNPSPQGGGFSVAGDNGLAVVVDGEAFNYSSIHGAVTVSGFFGSIHGVGGGVQAGYAHAVGI
jgi:hypothetical protein